MKTLNYSQTLVILCCANCGVPFAMPDNWERDFRRTGQTFYCPSGDHNYFPGGKSDEARIKELEGIAAKERDNAQFWREQEATRKRQLSAAKGRETRIKNRIAKGVCPCCNRQFVQLERHMASQHPEFAAPQSQAKGER